MARQGPATKCDRPAEASIFCSGIGQTGGYELRVQGTAPRSLVDVIEQVVQLPPGTTGSQIARQNMTRVSVSTHATRTNPTVTGRPVEVFYQRMTDGITAHVWPLPDGNGPYTMVYWCLRRIDDAGAYTNTADIPFRFLPAFISGLAFYLSQKIDPNNAALISRLESDYEKTWQRAADDDRERATLTIVPRGDSYRVN